jgi:hypothetical protein
MSYISLDDIVPGKARNTDAAAGNMRPVARNGDDKSAPGKSVSETVSASPAARVEGGFAAVRDDLDRSMQAGAAMVRQIVQHRHHLETAEKERDAAYAELARIVPLVQDTARELKTAMDRCKAGELGADLAGVFGKNAAALEDLEKTVVTLNGICQWTRSAWDQYARTVVGAQRVRSEMRVFKDA